ncbi:MAG: IS21 family transposase [Ilumatobacteraceae bacterium]|nr:IS21 family transposase [Ilumatobacteraceae bacterium]
MMTQEEFMDVLAMRRQGMSYVEIGEELGYHPATISKWVKDGGPPPARTVDEAGRVIDAEWADRLTALLVGNPKLLAKSLFEIISAEGFEGSYPTVARWVREQRGPRFRAADGASVPIETGPGEEAQFDFSDCSTWAQQVGLGPVLWCFGMILCWSRWRLWWFTTSVDRQHTFEGVARFFDAAGGVTQIARTDRMGALGQSHGRRFVLGPEALEFARHHGVEIKACQAGDAKRKGKVERPFRDLKESFLEELVVTGVPSSIDELNDRGRLWVDQRVHAREHRSTGVAPAERFNVERGFLGSLPARRFDTDYVESRRVHRALPFITWDGARYSVPPDCLGQLVEARVPVDGSELTVRWAGNVVARHRLATSDGDVWDPSHRAAAEASALASNQRRHLRVVEPDEEPTAKPAGRIELGGGDYDVAAPDLTLYEGGQS